MTEHLVNEIYKAYSGDECDMPPPEHNDQIWREIEGVATKVIELYGSDITYARQLLLKVVDEVLTLPVDTSGAAIENYFYELNRKLDYADISIGTHETSQTTKQFISGKVVEREERIPIGVVAIHCLSVPELVRLLTRTIRTGVVGAIAQEHLFVTPTSVGLAKVVDGVELNNDYVEKVTSYERKAIEVASMYGQDAPLYYILSKYPILSLISDDVDALINAIKVPGTIIQNQKSAKTISDYLASHNISLTMLELDELAKEANKRKGVFVFIGENIFENFDFRNVGAIEGRTIEGHSGTKYENIPYNGDGEVVVVAKDNKFGALPIDCIVGILPLSNEDKQDIIGICI